MMAMTPALDPNHPKLVLVFFVELGIDGSSRKKIREFVEQLSEIKEWVNGPPCFVDERLEDEEEAPIDAVGAYIELYSGWSPWKVAAGRRSARRRALSVLS
jgi:hypothetical protein